MFKVGDIIVGEEYNGYTYTTDNALMMVISTIDDMMNAYILCQTEFKYQIRKQYPVKNSENKFKLVTPKTFYEWQYDECVSSITDYEFKELCAKYGTETEAKTKEEPYVLSEEKRQELRDEIMELLVKYHYHPTQKGIDAILDEWVRNKALLIKVFEKHPNYNGNFQIVFSHDFSRECDIEASRNFAGWIQEIAKKLFVKEVVINNCPYKQLKQERSHNINVRRIFERYDRVETINGLTRDDYNMLWGAIEVMSDRYNYDDNICTICDGAYDKKLYDKYYNLHYLAERLTSTYYIEQFVNDDMAEFTREYFPECKIRKGQRLSRAVNKILTTYGFDKEEDYNRKYAKFADAVNPLKIARHTVISIHPVDYFTMSFGNSWSSCHTIDKGNDRGVGSEHNYRGCNSSGTESYMLDGTSCIFYTVSSDYNGNQFELQDKINRCMFHYFDNRLVQGRVYPQSNDDNGKNLYREIREITQKVFADMLEVPNYWNLKTGTSECRNAITSRGTHYRDYKSFDTCNVSTLKDDRDAHAKIVVGHNPIYPSCGVTHSEEERIECSYCWED